MVLKVDLPSILHKSDVGGVVMNLAQMAQDLTQIKEIDLNPVMSYDAGCLLLDARFIL